MAVRVLVVDDDPPVLRMLKRALSAEGFDVSVAADGGAALAALERSVPDLMVLDVAMPGMDGLAVARRLRERGITIPVLMLTARDEVADRVAGLQSGADDYLVKPFALEELVARLQALARRSADALVTHAVGDLRLDPATRRLTRAGQEIELTEREAALLALLMAVAPGVLTRERAIAEIWEHAAVPNVVDRYVTRLRQKLGEPAVIHTVRGRGFALRP
jgi:two-component system response regulator MprA